MKYESSITSAQLKCLLKLIINIKKYYNFSDTEKVTIELLTVADDCGVAHFFINEERALKILNWIKISKRKNKSLKELYNHLMNEYIVHIVE